MSSKYAANYTPSDKLEAYGNVYTSQAAKKIQTYRTEFAVTLLPQLLNCDSAVDWPKAWTSSVTGTATRYWSAVIIHQHDDQRQTTNGKNI